MIKQYLLTFIFSFLSLFVLSQEKVDTIDLFYKQPEPQINPLVFDFIFFNTYYPLSGDLNVRHRMNRMVFKELVDNSNYQPFSNFSNSSYQFATNGFHFWENTAPLELGANIHLNEIFKWDKLDVFMDAQGGLYNVYDYDEKLNVFVPTNKKAFSWNAGAGVGYKISKGNTIFIKSSISFDNISPMGKSNFGGMNMKF